MKYVLCCLLLVLLQTPCSFAMGQKKVLVVHSYHPEWEWVSSVSRGIKQKLIGRKDVVLQFLYMDTKRKDSSSWKEKIGAEMRDSINVWKPDVLLLVDDNAQKYVGTFYTNKVMPKIVFCGVNNKPEDYGYDKATNATGILERPLFKASLNLVEKINPAAKKFAVMTDSSITSKGAMYFIKKDAERIGADIIGFDIVETFSQWKAKIKEYQGKADAIIIYHYYVIKDEKTGENIEPQEVMEWTQKNSDLLVLDMSSPDNGAICGVDNSGFEHGMAAAEIVDNIIDGASVGDYPIRVAEKGISFLDIGKIREKGFSVEDGLKEEVDVLIEA